MSVHNYAKVLFELCIESNSLDEVFDDFTKFKEAMNKEQSWLSIINAPTLNKEEKRSLIKSLADFHPVFLNFLYLLLDQRFLNNYSKIYKQFYYQIMRSKKVAEVKVIKEELSSKQVKDITIFLSNQIINMEIKLIHEIDESLLGGVKMIYEDEIIDHSFLGLLKEMKEKV